MIRYLLDTDTASYLMKGKYPKLQHRHLREQTESWAVSAISMGEILFGLEPFPALHPVRLRAMRFIYAAQFLPWPLEAAQPYAHLRHISRFQPIGDRDLMIAAHAIAIDATLVTNNVRHFTRLQPELRFENWLDS